MPETTATQMKERQMRIVPILRRRQRFESLGKHIPQPVIEIDLIVFNVLSFDQIQDSQKKRHLVRALLLTTSRIHLER